MDRLSKQEIKQINRYNIKKYRQQDNRFLAEGNKVVKELINSKIKIERIIITPSYLNKYKAIEWPKNNFYLVDENEFKKISNQSTPEGILAVCEIPSYTSNDFDFSNWTIALDDLNIPGNMGTIIRLADWFGVDQIVCNLHSVDVFNAKVIQSSMGSLARVKIFYNDLHDLLSKTQRPVYIADIKGESIYTLEKPLKPGFLVIGNESHGVSAQIAVMATQVITIPKFGEAESLNAGVATGILLSHLVH